MSKNILLRPYGVYKDPMSKYETGHLAEMLQVLFNSQVTVGIKGATEI